MRYRNLSWKQVLNYVPTSGRKEIGFLDLEEIAKRLRYPFFVYKNEVYETYGNPTETQIDVDVS